MILVTLKPWQKIEGITHVRTLWEISDSESFLNILESTDSRDLLESYFSNIFVPVGSTYYVRATRIFNNGTRTQLDPIPVVNYGSDGGMLLADDVIIEAPFVYVNKDDIMSNNSKLKISTSEYRSEGDDHAYTHWIVSDGTGDILYCKLGDKVNRTSIEIDNSYLFKNKSVLNFMAIHGSNTGVESPVGKRVISLTSDYNFEINNGISWIEPLKDFQVVFTPIDKDKPMNIFKVTLLDYATERTVAELARTGDSFLIPFYYLKEGVKYKLCIYAYDKDLRYSNVYKELQVANLTNTAVRDPNYKYLDKIEEKKSYNSTLPNNPIHSEALYNMQVLIPKADKTVHIWDSNDINLQDSLGVADGLKVLSTNPIYTLIKPITKGLIMLDTPNENGKPTFLLYKYNNFDSTFEFVNSLTRDDETICLGKTNAIVQMSTTKFIYNPIGTNKLKIWDIETNTIDNSLQEIPLEGITKGLLLRMGNNSVLVCNGTTYKSKIYDYEAKAYRDGITFGPNSYVNADLRTFNLINGNTLIVKTSKIENDTESSCMVFDYKSVKFLPSTIRFDQAFPDITVSCGYGHCHMAKFVPGNKQEKIQDCYDVKVYL